jgi:hypothetical protein
MNLSARKSITQLASPNWIISHKDAWIITWKNNQHSFAINNPNHIDGLFQTTEKWIWMAQELYKLWIQGLLRWKRFLDMGCGNGTQWLTASLFSQEELLFLDTEEEALKFCEFMTSINQVRHRSSFLLWDDQYDAIKESGVSIVAANLPEDRYNPELCGDWWAELQIGVISKLWSSLPSGGHVLVKSVSYADESVELPAIQKLFYIKELSTQKCSDPDDNTAHSITYYLLTKKS